MAVWPCGRVAVWPCGRVAVWPLPSHIACTVLNLRCGGQTDQIFRSPHRGHTGPLIRASEKGEENLRQHENWGISGGCDSWKAAELPTNVLGLGLLGVARAF